MGAPRFPEIHTGVLSSILLHTVLSIMSVNDSIRSVLRAVGLGSHSTHTDEEFSSLPSIEGSGFESRLFLVSLSEEIRLALPMTLYDPAVGRQDQDCREDALCAVCLSRFVKDQEIRELPHCTHMFHKDCLDRWIEDYQSTCPLCRSSLIPDAVSKNQFIREQELSNEFSCWFSSFHGAAIQ